MESILPDKDLAMVSAIPAWDIPAGKADNDKGSRIRMR